jgi:hypothetical protein
LRDYEGSVFESKGVGDEYTDIKVLPLIIICYYSGRGIKKIFLFYLLYGNFNINKAR